MPESMIPEDIQNQFSSASQQASKAVSMSESSAKLPAMLRDAVSERMNKSPLIPAREKAVQEMMTTPANVREELSDTIQAGNILSPTQQQRVMAGERAQAAVPVMSINDLLNAQFGGMDTAVQAGLTGYETMLNSALARAQLAQDQAQGSWDRYLQGENLRMAQQETAREAASTSEPSLIEQLLAQQLSQQEELPYSFGYEDVPQEDAPQAQPSAGFVNRIESGGERVTGGTNGQWTWYSEHNDWLPTAPQPGTGAILDNGTTLYYTGENWVQTN